MHFSAVEKTKDMSYKSFKMQLIFFIIFSISLTVSSSAHNHFPITTESKIMIERGKLV